MPQPRQVRAFALFRLKLAKNDRRDAALIAHRTAELDHVRAAPDPRLEPLAEHLRFIEQLEADLARARTRAEAHHCRTSSAPCDAKPIGSPGA